VRRELDVVQSGKAADAVCGAEMEAPTKTE